MKKIVMLATVFGFAMAISASADDAKANWDAKCSMCHGADGKGATAMGKKLNIRDYTDAKVQESLKDDEATKAIKQLSETEKYDLVVQEAVYFNPKIDITDKIIKILNAGAK